MAEMWSDLDFGSLKILRNSAVKSHFFAPLRLKLDFGVGNDVVSAIHEFLLNHKTQLWKLQYMSDDDIRNENEE